MNIDIRIIQYLTPEYRDTIDLRNKILRNPLGIQFTQEDLMNEKQAIHIGAYLLDEPLLVGACFLTQLGNQTMKLRQMAVDTTFQNLGLGSKILNFAEKYVRSTTNNKICLHARKEAIGFYKKLGYEVQSEEFMEVGIAHYQMSKQLV